MVILMGEFHHNIDEKGRLVIPTKLRSELGDNFIITKGIENVLYVYPIDKWNKLVEKLETLSFTKKDARIFTRAFFSGAVDCTFDSLGRIILSEVHKSYAKITKECVILGVNDRLEIWSEENYKEYLNDVNNLDDVSERLFNDAL